MLHVNICSDQNKILNEFSQLIGIHSFSLIKVTRRSVQNGGLVKNHKIYCQFQIINCHYSTEKLPIRRLQQTPNPNQILTSNIHEREKNDEISSRRGRKFEN